MLSKKTRYAMMALSCLAQEYGNGPVLISRISEQEHIPKRFLENILQELRRSGYVDSKLGKTGGYFLVKDPQQINLLEIVRLFEGSVGMLYCISEQNYQPCEFCKEESLCNIRTTFGKIRKYAIQELKSTTLKNIIPQ